MNNPKQPPLLKAMFNHIKPGTKTKGQRINLIVIVLTLIAIALHILLPYGSALQYLGGIGVFILGLLWAGWIVLWISLWIDGEWWYITKGLDE
jgi:hypothetical protein